ncbi:hypothetical protein [Ktedonobacter racemifer]|uniref:Uncharacterized protein n=1 Tax=Ktedonobacter racemifer DSM 44963 TaxID=485913 RepID=D6U4D8_KTERA|nr:hypothetical protein [Ktedonobacter racemifer]EFH81368.1 conserved hypothetical protein [Ktedonobacter racemifer DSM 44963]
MNRMQAILHIHSKDWFWWLLAPWCWALLPSFAVNLIISLFAHTDAGIYTGGLVSIYIYMLIIGALVVYRTFSFALGFTMRRTDYILGTTLVAITVCAIEAIVLLLLSFIEADLTGGWGVRLHFFHLPYVSDGSFLAQFWVYFIALATLYALGFIIGSLYQRAGRTGLLATSGAALLLGTIGSFACTQYNWWGNIFAWLTHQSTADLASWFLLPLVACLSISYVLLRKATIA